MIKVRLLHQPRSIRKHSLQADMVIEVGAEEASRLIAEGLAEMVEPEQARAVKPATNRMTRPPINRTK